jgi:uncharacterized protein involved in outer membrane biogenesis
MLFAAGGIVSLVVLIVVVVVLVWSVNAKPTLEAFASEALGMEVKVGGRLGIQFLPSLHVTLQDVHIQNQGVEFASIGEATLGVELLALFHKEVRIERIGLKGLRISIERDRHGKLNVEKPSHSEETLPALDLARVSVADATLLYSDEQSGAGFKAEDCNLDVSRLRLARGQSLDLKQNISFTAELACGEIRTQDLTLSDVKLAVEGKDGIFDLRPITLRLFGGNGSGNVHADFSGAVPVYHVHGSLAKFRIEEFFKTVSPETIGEGSMDFSANLSIQGKTTSEMNRSVAGEASLHGENLKFEIDDLDQQLSRYDSSQNFNLVDVGAFFFAGPLGLAVTKGYNFANIFKGSRSSSTLVRTLVSEWKVERGVAQAQDAAMATAENRIALKGALDFVNKRFDDMTVAVIDAKGCPTVQQKIRGPFLKPEVEKPSVITGLTGSTRKLLKQVGRLLGGRCTVFYAGSVPPPK